MRVTSGTIHDSPWRDDSMNRIQPMSTLPTNPATRPRQQQQHQQQQPNTTSRTLTDWMLYTTVQLFCFLDLSGCILLFVYGLLVKSNPDAHWPAGLALESATVLGLRFLAVMAALYYRHVFDLHGFIFASYISILLHCQTDVVLIATLVLRNQMKSRDWWIQHFWMQQSIPDNANAILIWFLNNLEPWLWLFWLIWIILEFPLRWYVYRLYQRRLLQQEQDDLIQTAFSSRMAARTGGRPWWWSRSPRNSQLATQHNSLQQALLSDRDAHNDVSRITTSTSSQVGDEEDFRSERRPGHGSAGMPGWAAERQFLDELVMDSSSPQQQQSMFSWLRFWKRSSSKDPREDGSVDFASVQEEWASRSEQDPLWWSRDQRQQDPQEATGVPEFVNATSTIYPPL